MRKFIILCLMTLLIFSSSASAAECTGTDVINFSPGDRFVVCWEQVPGDITGYRIYQSSTTNELGSHVSTIYSDSCSEGVCERDDMLAPITEGNYYYKVTAFRSSVDVTYDKYNSGTGETEQHTYTLPEEESAPSNEVIALVVTSTQKESPSGCSIRRYF